MEDDTAGSRERGADEAREEEVVLCGDEEGGEDYEGVLDGVGGLDDDTREMLADDE